MKTFRTMAFAAMAVLAFTGVSGPAGSGVGTGCGAVLSIQDPQLRALFAEFDRTRTTDFAQVCALTRNVVGR